MRVVLDEISHRSAPTAYLQQLAEGDRAEQQLGTLGGGNHFLEVCRAISSQTQSAFVCLARRVLRVSPLQLPFFSVLAYLVHKCQ